VTNGVGNGIRIILENTTKTAIHPALDVEVATITTRVVPMERLVGPAMILETRPHRTVAPAERDVQQV